jgi:uncharacterized ion transporter superfamily protein YfcC
MGKPSRPVHRWLWSRTIFQACRRVAVVVCQLLIVILMVIFSLGGTTYGMAEETLGFYAIILPVIIGPGYDQMVGVGIIMVGAGVGTLASTVNPFATGVASDARGWPWGWHRAAADMYVVITALTVAYVLWYARRVRADPGKSMLPALAEDRALAGAPAGPPAPMSGPQKVVLWIFGLTFLLMIFSVIPWGDFSASLESITLGWYFPELAALFLVGAVLIGWSAGWEKRARSPASSPAPATSSAPR